VQSNVDERLLGRWQESQQRQKVIRRYFERSSLPLDRFESRALELIGDALLPPRRGEERTRTSANVAGVARDDDR
jgi:hypothetical protein